MKFSIFAPLMLGAIFFTDGAPAPTASQLADDFPMPPSSPTLDPMLGPPIPQLPPTGTASPYGGPTPNPTATAPPENATTDPPYDGSAASPSFSPSSAPSPSDECFVQVEVNCTPPLPFENCDSIIGFREECHDVMFSMGFRYNGGNCDQSFNEQQQIFMCEDFGGGPPVNASDESFIVVSDSSGLGIVYHSDFVPVGGFFTVVTGAQLPEELYVNITIYDSDVLSPSNIRQTVLMHTLCHLDATFLKDRFGAVELLWFNNTEQGNVTGDVDLKIDFYVQSVAEGFIVGLSMLTSNTNFKDNDFINMTSQVAGMTLNPGQTAPFSFGVTIDTSISKRYTASSSIQGLSPEGSSCQGADILDFTAGGSLDGAPFAPTLPPVQAPVA